MAHGEWPKPLEVEIDIDELGRGKIVVGGLDISSHVKHLTIEASPKHELTEVALELLMVKVQGRAKGVEKGDADG